MSCLEELLPAFRKGARIRISTWPKNQYIYKKGKEIYNEDGEISKFLDGYVMTCDLWELYQEPIDWDYVIANSCPCWFWNNDKNLRVKGTLMEVDDTCDYSFRISLYNTYYKNCCPCRRDEVTFYEDMKK